jgi:hypothetical protein
MAFLYKRNRSPFWWLSWRDPATGRRHMDSTNLRVADAASTRAANRLAAEARVRELSTTPKASRGSYFSAWVPSFLDQITVNPGSRKRYNMVWRALRLWLAEHRLTHPRHVTRQLCLAYPGWRQSCPTLRRVVHNTALYDLKILGMILDEAVRRNLLSANPCRRLGLRRQPVTRLKPELDESDFAALTAVAARFPRHQTFLERSLLLSRYQGCRLMETQINPMRDVNLTDGTITFQLKGGRYHSAPLHPALVPLFTQLQAEGATTTYPPIKTAQPSNLWWRAFRASGVSVRKPFACFHSIRVTAISRMARKGVSITHAMAIVGHASSTVHRVYQRVRVDDLRGALDALS